MHEGVSQVSKKSIFKDLIILFILLLTLYLSISIGAKIALGVDKPFMIVVSRSMEPTIHVNDIIIVKRVDPHTLKVGDIIVYRDRYDPSIYIVHRIVKILRENPPIFITKGDNNRYVDTPPVEADQVVGKVIFIIPYIGIIPRIFSPPVNYIVIAIVASLLIILIAKDISENSSNLSL